MKESEHFSFKKRLLSFRFAFNGIFNLIKNEHNARIHVVALVLVILLGIILEISSSEWIAITIVSGLVVITELLNTAIERLADFVEPNWNEKIGITKDYCAGAVLISAIIAVIVGVIIFLPPILEIL